MIGTRLPDLVHVTGHESFDLRERKPGAYIKCVDLDGSVTWWVCDPLGHWGTLQHEVTEHDDGTITVSPSIWDTKAYPGGPGYHGWLRAGVWSEA